MAGRAEQFARALAFEDEGRPEEALECYSFLVEADPRDADAWHNRGLLLARLGRLDDAEESHRRYIDACPESARAHGNLADVLLALQRYHEALTVAGRAVQFDPTAFLPHFSAGLAAAMLMRFEQAEKWFRLAERADAAGFQRFLVRNASSGALDRDLDPRAIYLIREFDRLEQCDWRNYHRYVETFGRLIEEGLRTGRPISAPPLLFRSLQLPLPIETRRQLADSVAQRLMLSTAPLRTSYTRRRQSGRIKVGYVSSDFRTHPTAILSRPLFELHDRSKFEVHVFSLSSPDDSPWGRAIRGAADRVHELAGLSFGDALAQVRTSEIDILVDLNGPTTGALPELFAARAAPVQVSYLAYPGTSGAGLVDYLLCDAVCVPESEESGYSEALLRLAETFWIGDPDMPLASLPSRASQGLPEAAVVFLAHHPSRKICPEVFSVWMQILAAVPNSVLWLLEDLPAMRHNLGREAESRGISPHRLVFSSRVPNAEHHARIRLADLALDTLWYNGGTTTLDALAAGIPVLTCPTPGFAGRMGASALRAAGLEDLVFPNLPAYTAAAIALGKNNDGRARLSERAREARASSLFDFRRRVSELEAVYHRLAAA